MRRDGLSDACHFVCCQFVSMCSSATGLQLLHSSKKKKSEGMLVWVAQLGIESVTVFLPLYLF